MLLLNIKKDITLTVINYISLLKSTDIKVFRQRNQWSCGRLAGGEVNFANYDLDHDVLEVMYSIPIFSKIYINERKIIK